MCQVGNGRLIEIAIYVKVLIGMNCAIATWHDTLPSNNQFWCDIIVYIAHPSKYIVGNKT